MATYSNLNMKTSFRKKKKTDNLFTLREPETDSRKTKQQQPKEVDQEYVLGMHAK